MVGELILTGDTLNSGRVKINQLMSGNTQLNLWNSAGTQSIISINSNNTASGNYSLTTGFNNTNSGNYSTVIGGTGSTISGNYSLISGSNNTNNADYSNILGGSNNLIESGVKNSAIISGTGNTIDNTDVFSDYSFIGGGRDNLISQTSNAIICSGSGSTNSGLYGGVVSGLRHKINSDYGFIGGGSYNSAQTGTHAAVTSGKSNKASGAYSFIGGGSGNTASGGFSGILAGQNNTITNTGTGSIILGGTGNTANQVSSIIYGNNITSSSSYGLFLGKDTTVKIRMDFENGIIYAVNTAVQAADYAEYFELKNIDSTDKRGLFISLSNNGKVEVGNSNIIGAVSSTPSVIGDSASLYWKDLYLTDEFGCKIIKNFTSVTTDINEKYYINESGNILSTLPNIQSFTGISYNGIVSGKVINSEKISISMINPKFNPNEKYIPRSERNDWICVALLGKVPIRTNCTITGNTVDSDKYGYAINGMRYNILETMREWTPEQYGIVKILLK